MPTTTHFSIPPSFLATLPTLLTILFSPFLLHFFFGSLLIPSENTPANSKQPRHPDKERNSQHPEIDIQGLQSPQLTARCEVEQLVAFGPFTKERCWESPQDAGSTKSVWEAITPYAPETNGRSPQRNCSIRSLHTRFHTPELDTSRAVAR